MRDAKKFLLVALLMVFVLSFKTNVSAAEIDTPADDEIIESYESEGHTISSTTYGFYYQDELATSYYVEVGLYGGYSTNWDEGFSGWVSPCWATITSLKIDGVSRNLVTSTQYNATGSSLTYSFYDPTGTYIISKHLVIRFYCDEWGYDYGWYIRIE